MPTAAGLYYFAHESQNLSRPPVILIHGAGGTHLHWPPQIRRLPDQRIFALDLPGHGKSEGVGHQTIDDYAENILDFMKAIKLNSAVLVGHSMGGAIALTAAIRSPKQVSALGLVGSGAKLRVSPAILHSASNPFTFADAVQRISDFSYSEHASARLKELGGQKLSGTRPTVLYGDFLACDAFNAADQLPQISAPTLIVCGADDRMTPPKYSELLRDGILDARMEIVPGAGHMVMLEQPEAVANLLADFFNSIPFQAGQD